MEPFLGVGVVGGGYASQTFHLPLIASVPGLRLTAVATSRPACLDRWPGVVACSPPDLWARSDVDLVVIASPNDTHFDLASAALAAGKHVVVDKPFTLTVAEAEALVAQSQAVNRRLSVFHNRRWDADYLTLRGLVASGTLGPIVCVESRIERFRPQVRTRWREGAGPGSGLWYDLGPHLVDQALGLFGQPQGLALVTASLRDGALTDDWFQATLDYPGLRVILGASVVAARPGPRFVAHGTLGTYTKTGVDPQEEALKVGTSPLEPGWGIDPRPGVLSSPERDDELVPNLPGNYRAYYLGVRDALLGDAPLPVTAAEGLSVMRWIEAGRESVLEGSRFITTT